MVLISDGSGMEEVGFGRARIYPNSHISGLGLGMVGIGKVGFGREMKSRVSGIFR